MTGHKAELNKEHKKMVGAGYYKAVGEKDIAGKAVVRKYRDASPPEFESEMGIKNESKYFATGAGRKNMKRGGSNCNKKKGGSKKLSKKVSKALKKASKKMYKRMSKKMKKGGSVCPEQKSVYTPNMKERKFGCKQNKCHDAKCI